MTDTRTTRRFPSRPSRGPLPAPLPAALAAIGFCSLLWPALPAQAQSLPTGGQVVGGSATIRNPGPTQQVITQNSDKAIINWQGFSIGQGYGVQFLQPGSGSVVLNRVVGGDPSAIFGSLTANGRVFLVNPQGIFFSPTASLDVGGLVASTLGIRNEDFLSGRYIFTRDAHAPAGAAVINEGLIRARDGGYVVLAGDYAANRGVVEARLGSVALASGARVTLDMQGDRLISLAVNEKTVAELAGVANSGELNAEGGRVMMTAAVARDLAGTVVNNSGIVRARGTVEQDGAIYLVGDGGDVGNSGRLDAGGVRGGSVTVQSKTGTTQVSGHIDATGDAGRGGIVQVLGHHAGVTGRALIDASGTSGGGTVLIGGDYQGANATVPNALRSHVGAGATIRADATQLGDGGRVIVWADDVTRYYGAISARGGLQGGNGGFAEVSGKASLVFNGSADLRAPQGDTGTLLLDPKNIRITAAGAAVVADNDAFSDNPAATSDLSAANVIAAMNGSNLVLQAHNDITLETDLNIAGGAGTANRDLALQAGRHIILASAPDTANPGNSTGAVTVTMNGGGFSATTNVNATDAPGFLSANRDAGAAEFFMATGSAISGAGSATIAAGNNAFPTLNANSGAFNVASIQTTGGAIQISAFNTVTINGSLDSGGGAVTVTADGHINVGATGSIAAGAGTATLKTTETLNSETDINLSGGISAAKVVLNSADAITQTGGGITAAQLRVMAASGTENDNVDLTGGNNVGTIAAAKSDTAAGAGGISVFTFNNGANTLTVGSVDAVSGITAVPAAASRVTLTAGDLVISQGIGTGSGSGVVTLQAASGINASLGGTAAFDLTQAELDRITTGALRIGGTAGTGALSVDSAIVNGPNWNTLILRAGSGGVSQTQPLTVTSLGIESGGPVNLDHAGNAVSNFAAAVTGGGALLYRDADALTVANVGVDAGNNPIAGVTVSGITTVNGDATLATGDALTINQNIGVGSGVLTLDVTRNGATQGPGSAISANGAGGVRLLGNAANTNNFSLDQNNDVANLAASTNGSVSFRNTAAATTLTVGSVGGTSGIITNGSAVTLIADEMAISQDIASGAGSVTLTSHDPARAINLGAGTAGLNLSDAALDRIISSGQLTIGDNAHTGSITVSGETVSPANASGGIVLRNVNSSININSVLGAGAAAVTLIADGGDPAAATGGVITQTAGGGIAGSVLTTQSKGGTTLTAGAANNAVGNFSAFESGGGDIAFANTGNLVVNGIGLGSDDNVRHVNIDTSGTLSANGLITTHSAASNVTLGSGGAMTLVQDINPGGSGVLALNSSSTVAMSGKVVANDASGGGAAGGLLLTRRGGSGGGAFTFSASGNNVATIAAAISGALQYGDTDALAVGSLSGTGGINTGGSNVTLTAAGNLALNAAIVATGATIDLTAPGITTGGGSVTANLLAVRDNNTANAGSYVLGGNVAGLAANINGTLSYSDANAFAVTSAAGISGILTRGGGVTLASGSATGAGNQITLLQNIDTRSTPGAGGVGSGGTVVLNAAGGGVNQTSGSITASALALLGSGTYTLDSDPGLGGVNNDVNTFAAGAAAAGPTTGLMNVAFRDVNSVAIGTAGGATGLTTRGGNATVITESGNLTVSSAVDTRSSPFTAVDAANPTTSGGDITLTTLAPVAAADIVLNASVTGDIVTLNSQRNIPTAPGVIVNATVNTANLAGETWIGIGADAPAFNSNLNADTVVIYTTNGADITQTGGSITANNLLFFSHEGDSVFNFTGGSNNVQNFAASSNYFGFFLFGGSSRINLATTGPLNVTAITPTRYYTGGANGIFSNNQDVTLGTGGTLALTAPVNAGSGNVGLNAAAGGISQTAAGAVTANTLGISSPGSVNLGLAGNNVNTLGDSAINVSDALFRYHEAGNVSLGTINVGNPGAATLHVTAGGTITLPAGRALTATSVGDVAAANVILSGGNGVSVSSPITATGGGASSGVNAGVSLLSANGPVTMFFGAGVTATDNGPATAAGAAPHSAEVVMTSGSRSAWVANCAFNDVCITTAGNVTATSNHGRAVIDLFGQGDAGDGVRVVGALTATGQTRPLIKLDAVTKDSEGNEQTSTGNITTSAPITVVSTSGTAVNTLPDSVIGGVSISGRNITVGGRIESRHSDGVSRAQDGISIANVRQNININADIVTTSNGGIGITTGSNGTISGSGVIEAQNVNLVAPKSQGSFNVRTRIQPPAGIAGSGNLNVLGGDVMTIENLSTTTLIAALGFIDRSQDPVNPDLPIGDLTLKTPGALQIATLDAYNQARHERNGFFGPLVPARIELVSDNFIVFPGTISTPAWAEVTLRPYTDTTEIFVRNNADPSLPGVVYTAAPLTGLLQQFNPDAKLIIGGPNHKGNVTVGGDGLFTLGNMHLVFETGQTGRVVKNFFSSNGNIYHPEPAIPFGSLGYPGPNVSDGIGQLTSDRVQLIEAGSFQPSPGVTINGSCTVTCPGGSIGQGSITVSGGSTSGGGSSSSGSSGGGGSSSGGGTSSGGTDLGGPGATGTGTAAGTGGTGGGGSTTPADTTGSGGGTGGTPADGSSGGAVADGGGSLSGPADGGSTLTTSTDGTPAEDGGGIIAGDGSAGPGDGTIVTGPGDGGTVTGPGDGTTGPGDGDITPGGTGPFTGGGDGGTLAGGPGDGVTGGTGDGLPTGGGTLAGGDPGDGTTPGGTGLAGGGAGDGITGGPGGTTGGDGTATAGTGIFDGGASGGGSLAGGSTIPDGGSVDGSGAGTGAAGGGIADGSGSTGGSGAVGGGGSGLADAAGDGALGGGASGGTLAGDGSSAGGTGSGLAGAAGGGGSGIDGSAAGLDGDGIAGGAIGGGSLADGSGLTGSGSGLADTGGGSGAAGGGSGTFAGGADGGLAAGSSAGFSGGGSGGADAGLAGSSGGLAGNDSGVLAGGEGGFLAGSEGGFLAGSGSSPAFGDGSGGGGTGIAGSAGGTLITPLGEAGAGAFGNAAGADGSLAGGSGGLIAGGGSAGGQGNAQGGGGGFSGGGGDGPGFFGDPSAAQASGGTFSADAATASDGSALAGELRGGASGGSISMVPGDSSGGRSGTGAGEDGNTARGGTATAENFRGGGAGGNAASDAGGDDGRSDSAGGKGDERERYFEDERDARRLRLVGGNRLIAVEGDGVNLRHGGQGAAAGAASR